mgnify:CR=1 FL=1
MEVKWLFMDLEFEVVNQSVKKINRKELANKSQEYLQLSFTFKTTDWSDLTKFVLFKKGSKAYRVAIENNKVLVPNACLTGDRFTFMVYGVNDDVRVTTAPTLVYLAESGYTTEVEDDLPDDDPTIVEQIYEAIDTKADKETTYTKAEVDALIHRINNNIRLTSENEVIQTGDTNDLTAYVTINGIPPANKTVYFYAIEEEDE